VKTKSSSKLPRNQIQASNILQHVDIDHINHQPSKVKESSAVSCGKATESMWSKLCHKKLHHMCQRAERTTILKQSATILQLLINSDNELCGARRCIPQFHRHVKQTTPSADESINDERTSPTHEVATDSNGCIVCLTDVQLEALWRPTKSRLFSIHFQSTSLQNNSNNLLISHSLLFSMKIYCDPNNTNYVQCIRCYLLHTAVSSSQRFRVWWDPK